MAVFNTAIGIYTVIVSDEYISMIKNIDVKYALYSVRYSYAGVKSYFSSSKNSSIVSAMG